MRYERQLGPYPRDKAMVILSCILVHSYHLLLARTSPEAWCGGVLNPSGQAFLMRIRL